VKFKVANQKELESMKEVDRKRGCRSKRVSSGEVLSGGGTMGGELLKGMR